MALLEGLFAGVLLLSMVVGAWRWLVYEVLSLAGWVAAFLLAQWLAPQAGHGLSEHLYVVDPQGQWMMRFPARMDAAGATQARRDLERLLRASASWDQPGRAKEHP